MTTTIKKVSAEYVDWVEKKWAETAHKLENTKFVLAYAYKDLAKLALLVHSEDQQTTSGDDRFVRIKEEVDAILNYIKEDVEL